MSSDITIRAARPSDLARTAEICFHAFNGINLQHGYAADLPSVDVAADFTKMLIGNPHIYGIVAEMGDRVVGSNFLWYGAIGGIGPITIDPGVQEQGIGKKLMLDVLRHAEEKQLAGTRLVQAAFNVRSYSLYAKLGFDVREPLVVMNGAPPKIKFPGCEVHPMTQSHVPACCDLCTRVHGHDRRGELFMGIQQGTAHAVRRDGQITGYVADLGFFGHSLGLENLDLMALIGSATAISGPGFLLPSRNGELFRWCLQNGLRLIEPMTLMSRGLYNQPSGAFLPSVLF